MSRLFTSSFVAAALAVLMGSVVAAQNRGVVPVNVQPAASVPVVLFSPSDGGTTLTTTGRDGKGSFNIADLANKSSNKFLVVEEKCGNQTRILIVTEEDANAASKKCWRVVGAYVPGRDAALNAKLSGMGAVAKAGFAAAVAGGALGATALLSGGEPRVPREEQKEQQKVDVTSFSGLFNITATKIIDTGCNFSPSFSGQTELSVSSDGSRVVARMIERLTRPYTGTIDSNGSIKTSGSGNIGARQYVGTLDGRRIGNSFSGVETLNLSTGCANGGQGQVAYQVIGTIQ